MIRWGVALWSACLVIVPACHDDGAKFAVTPDAGVLVGAVTEVAVESFGGGFPGAAQPAGAGCNPQLWRLDVTLGSGLFSWRWCTVMADGGTAADYVLTTGSRTLTASELAGVEAALAAVRVSARTDCGADKERLTMTVVQGSAQMVYGDDFYACDMMEAQYVQSQGLDALVSTLTTLPRG
jgi:hypothetical protein